MQSRIDRYGLRISSAIRWNYLNQLPTIELLVYVAIHERTQPARELHEADMANIKQSGMMQGKSNGTRLDRITRGKIQDTHDPAA